MRSDFLETISSYNIRKAAPTAGSCALLVIDMQEYFSTIASSIFGNVLSIIEVCRSRGIRVIFTRHGHQDLSRDGGMLDKWWGDSIMYGTKKWELLRALQVNDYDGILDKDRYNAFHNTRLDESLKSIGVNELIITGVLTNCCCETTAREAFVRDYRVFFVSDATATVNEDLHVSTLKNLAFGFAHILSADQVCRDLTVTV